MAKEIGDFEEISGKSGEQQRGQFVISRQTKVTSHRALVQNFQCGPFAGRMDLPQIHFADVVPILAIG
jgi:hypothetical protein